MHFEDTERLLDTYLAALGVFYDAHKPTLGRWVRRDANQQAKQLSGAQLKEASFNYWIRVEVYDTVSARNSGRANLLTA
jgi:hypothetical protein